MKQLLLLILLAFSTTHSIAGIEVHQFDSTEKETLYRNLTQELRCLVCQNQNLADSNAELAVDLREEVYEMINAGSSRQEIVDFMVARYGDFVLYRPPVKANTALLWIGPFIILIIALVTVIIFARRHRPESNDQEELVEVRKDT